LKHAKLPDRISGLLKPALFRQKNKNDRKQNYAGIIKNIIADCPSGKRSCIEFDY